MFICVTVTLVCIVLHLTLYQATDSGEQEFMRDTQYAYTTETPSYIHPDVIQNGTTNRTCANNHSSNLIASSMQNHLQSTSFLGSMDEETPPSSSSSFQPTKTNFQEPPPSPPPPSLNQPSITRQAPESATGSGATGAAQKDAKIYNKNQNNHSQNNQRYPNQAQAEMSNSRPSSQLSHTGSSGYGSTRSQVGPFAKDVLVDPSASSGISNRPSPAGSSTSGVSSGAGSVDKPLIPKIGILKNSSKRSVWWGGSSMRGTKSGRSLSAESRPSSEMGTSTLTRASPAAAGPQFASLRIPNRIRHSNSQGDLPSHVSEESISEPGIELADAEIDSTGGIETNPELMVIHVTEKINNLRDINGGEDKLSVAVPQAAPRHNTNNDMPCPEKPSYMNMPPYPLRHSSSLDSQVCLFILFSFHNYICIFR